MPELMSLRDVAGLAHVRRPVVSVWRRRSRASAHPFPAPHQRRGSQELFLRDDIVAWLEATQRGNNPDVRADAASHTLLASGGRRDAEALSALLTLRHLAGRSVAALAADELLDLADEYDPDDRFLFGELERVDDLAGLALVTDDLVEAAWDEQSAHCRLMDARLRVPGSGLAQTGLSGQARKFVLGLFGPLSRELGRPAVMDATGCAVDTLVELGAALDLPAIVMNGATAAHRLTVRQLLLADVPHRTVDRGTGDWSVTGPVAHLLVLPTALDPMAHPVSQLELLDEVALQLDAQQLALCLAPASTLTDPLDGETVSRRDQFLRDGMVRAIVRLPAGLRPAHAREHSALWLLGPADQTPPAERRVLVGDLAGLTIAACEGLADDVLAAWQGREGARRRAWAHLHPVLTGDLIASSGSLVPPKPARSTSAHRSGADWAIDLHAADTAGRLAGYRYEVLDQTAEEVTIAQAVERGWVRVLPGRRLTLDGLPPGTVPVLDTGMVSGDAGRTRAVDRLALLSRTSTELTEPGDIIFTVKPAPAAMIDTDGGSLVLAPARVLRLRPGAPLVARAIVARINAATTATWRTWTLRTVPEPDRAALGEALSHLAEERARLVADLAALDTLTNRLTTAVESRQLRITKENHGPTQG